MKNTILNITKYILSYILGKDLFKKLQFIITNKPTEQSLLCNTLLSKFKKPTCYLEIGVDQGNTFRNIIADIKHGVDPYGTYDVTHRMTSEMFFALNQMFIRQKYDVIFIDASHLSLIVDNEIQNCLKILKKNGYIVLHDTDPLTKEASEVKLDDTVSYLRKLSYPYNKSHSTAINWKPFNGDVWKSIAKIRMEYPRLSIFTINKFCCTVIKRGKQNKLLKKVPISKLSWNYFIKNRIKILNIIEFKDINKYI